MDREMFLTWTEDVLRPGAAPGAEPGGDTPYRTVRIGTRQYIGVDALHNGVLRVYLYSSHPPLKERWLRLKNALELNDAPTNLDPLPPGSSPRLFMRDNGEQQRGFFGFEWQGANDLTPERAPLSQYVTWLLHVARKEG
ncbi:hypothetical protein JRI60_10865 [Archangium violaceum]|uniref:hypothetical protein n=1 Tax=Archangium violaceum TaxID=83451 RepID=UPI0019510B5D|nr:hypothetical protein [Archangium violaceum]QRN99479.1 hypothetical protein JRI60_10865 [Archangium violaceum]